MNPTCVPSGVIRYKEIGNIINNSKNPTKINLKLSGITLFNTFSILVIIQISTITGIICVFNVIGDGAKPNGLNEPSVTAAIQSKHNCK